MTMNLAFLFLVVGLIVHNVQGFLITPLGSLPLSPPRFGGVKIRIGIATTTTTTTTSAMMTKNESNHPADDEPTTRRAFVHRGTVAALLLAIATTTTTVTAPSWRQAARAAAADDDDKDTTTPPPLHKVDYPVPGKCGQADGVPDNAVFFVKTFGGFTDGACAVEGYTVNQGTAKGTGDKDKERVYAIYGKE